MASFRPFRGIRFVAERSGDMEGIVAPPYDVISSQGRDDLYKVSPYNVARLILNRQGHREAGELFRHWLDQGSLERDEEPCFYLYCQDFHCQGPKRRVGVIGALGLEPFSTGVVRPHERTFARHKEDRLALTRQVKANLSPIFGLYSNPGFCPHPEGGWDSAADIDLVHENVRSRLWTLSRPGLCAEIERALEGRTVFLADGHHRYETALAYARLARASCPLPPAAEVASEELEPALYVMAFLATFEDPGMVVLPTHRELRCCNGVDRQTFLDELARDFELEALPRSPEGRGRLLAGLDDRSADANVLGIALRDHPDYLLIRRPCRPVGQADPQVGELDVSVLHDRVLGRALEAAGGRNIEPTYTVNAEQLLDRVERGASEAAFLLRPTRVEQMAAVCMAGELMPQKSTYFYPKLLTGLVFHSLEH